MYSKNVVIMNKSGLHARPASDFTKLASKYKSKVTVQKGETNVNAKSILFILGLGVTKGTEIEICADGPDETEAVHSLVALVEAKFNEE